MRSEGVTLHIDEVSHIDRVCDLISRRKRIVEHRRIEPLEEGVDEAESMCESDEGVARQCRFEYARDVRFRRRLVNDLVHRKIGRAHV